MSATNSDMTLSVTESLDAQWCEIGKVRIQSNRVSGIRRGNGSRTDAGPCSLAVTTNIGESDGMTVCLALCFSLPVVCCLAYGK